MDPVKHMLMLSTGYLLHKKVEELRKRDEDKEPNTEKVNKAKKIK